MIYREDESRIREPNLRENFSTGHFVGVPGLQQYGMTDAYPRMRRWLRD